MKTKLILAVAAAGLVLVGGAIAGRVAPAGSDMSVACTPVDGPLTCSVNDSIVFSGTGFSGKQVLLIIDPADLTAQIAATVDGTGSFNTGNQNFAFMAGQTYTVTPYSKLGKSYAKSGPSVTFTAYD